MHPVIHVVCQQRGCVHEGRIRQIHLRRVGVDAFEIPAVACACNPSIEMRRVPAPDVPVELEADVPPFHQWVLDEGHISEPCS